jgi:hypothetical protein
MSGGNQDKGWGVIAFSTRLTRRNEALTQILKLGKVLIAAMVAAWVGGFATPESAPFVADYQANAFEEGGDIVIDCAA